jgi:flagellar motor switch protein FliN/FliY
MAETLSQQEIDELLRQAMGDAGAAARAPDSPTGLSAIEMDALGEISNISMGAAATALHTILGRRVVITTPDVTVVPLSHVTDQHVVPYVMVDVEYASGFAGHNLFILQIDDVKAMTDVMMGGAGVAGDEELSELHLSAISEARTNDAHGYAMGYVQRPHQHHAAAEGGTLTERISVLVSPIQ